ncbi:MAG TPA: ribosome small subunit-dependent GTPase A, partial [Candidatus Limnocylindria bacterium]|nr:ribosome small subunit-dependent GTPase A [Candidatus Limnocylindria bacterium]
MHSSLDALGWDPTWDAVRATFAFPDCAPARVAVQHRGGYILYAPEETAAAVSGRLRHEARDAADFPAVGDWVLARDGVIHAVLPRRSAFARKAVLDALEPQIAAANVDVVFVVESLEGGANLRRIERYLTVAYESGARPVVLLSKADLCPDVAAALRSAGEIAPGTPVGALSARTGEGLEVFDRYCGPGRTAVFLGPSGVGKTTLLNALSGQERPTAAVLADGRGRHTTTHRELVLVPRRGLVIDTPGMRELQLWDADGGLGAVFADIEALARGCRFDDCAHASEPGCAVRAAI